MNIVMSMSVCVCVCVYLSVCEDISGTTRVIFTEFFAYDRGLVLLRQGDEIPSEGAILGFPPLTMHCTA